MNKLIAVQSSFDFIKNQTYHIAFYGDNSEPIEEDKLVLFKYIDGGHWPNGYKGQIRAIYQNEIEKIFSDNLNNISNTIINDLTLAEYDLIISPPSSKFQPVLIIDKKWFSLY